LQKPLLEHLTKTNILYFKKLRCLGRSEGGRICRNFKSLSERALS
jgi:hypothetical protein